VAARDQHAVASFHVPVRVVDRFIRTTPVRYVRTLNRPNPGVIVRISEFLNANAAPGDVVLTNYAWESLYFYTGLPQAMKVARWFPIYSAARARGLPDYVFDTAGVRWIVWRRAWPAAFPEQDCGALLRRLAEAGITTVLAASIPESLYENRENVHFRRWADQQYVFPWYGPFPDVLIFRVDWESDVASLRERAEALLGRHELREAIVHFREYLKARPDDLVAWTRLGAALADAGNIGEAIPAFRQVANAAPEDAAAQKNMANALLEHGEAAQAESYARRAVALNAADAGSYDALGRALAAQGKAGEAMGQFELALKLDPANEFARDHLAQIRPSRARR
jgi:tetratricopeptide (TPR) repeat protein